MSGQGARQGAGESAGGRGPADHLAAHRWPKGTSGNPGGRPRGGGLTALLRQRLEETHNGRPIADIVIDALIKGALQGKHQHLKELLDRVEGKVADRTEISTPEQGGLRVYVVRKGEALPPEVQAQRRVELSEDTWNAL